MKSLFEVKISYTAIVLAKDSDDAEAVAKEEKSEIVSDIFSPEIEVLASFRSRKELDAYGHMNGVEYDHDMLPYGYDDNTEVGDILDAVERHDIDEADPRKTIDMFAEADPVAVQEPSRPPDFRLLVARKHAKAGEDWHWCRMEFIDNGPHAGSLIEGAVPNIAPDGSRRWVGVRLEQIFVLESEVRAAELVYEAETGNCHACAGSGMRNTGWSSEHGNTFGPCKRCDRTGKAVANV